MPRFFFDVLDGDELTRDVEGDELPGWQEAREYAAGLLTEITNVDLASADRREFVVNVRDATGRMGCSATMSFAVERHADPPIAKVQ